MTFGHELAVACASTRATSRPSARRPARSSRRTPRLRRRRGSCRRGARSRRRCPMMKSSAIGPLKTRFCAELLLHPLRDVEDAALVPVGDVLAPDVGVGVAAELFLERRVDGLDQRHLGSPEPSGRPSGHCAGTQGSGTTNSKIDGGRRVGRRLRAVGGLLVGLPVLRLDRGELRLVDEAALEQRAAGSAEADRRPAPPRAPRASGRAPAGRSWSASGCARSCAWTIAQPAPAADELDRLAHRAEGVEDVQAVAVDDPRRSGIREKLSRGVLVGRLVALRHGDAVAVVLDDEDDRAASRATRR